MVSKVNLIACISMILVQAGYAAMNVLAKLAMGSGMDPYVHTVYRQVFATVLIIPAAFYLERNARPAMSKKIFIHLVLSSLFGATLNQVLYLVGLKHTTATIAVALYNASPAITYILSILFRQENVGIKQRFGQAKILGTIFCVGGAMIVSFYNGPQILPISGYFSDLVHKLTKGSSGSTKNNLLGPIMILASTIAGAIYYIIQAKLSTIYPVPLSTSAWICALSSLQCSIIAVAVDHRAQAWSLSPFIRAISTTYAGVVCSAFTFWATAWCVERKGALYVSVFSPLQLIIVAFLGWMVLDEVLFLGCFIGSLLIVTGLYIVVWGKKLEEAIV